MWAAHVCWCMDSVENYLGHEWFGWTIEIWPRGGPGSSRQMSVEYLSESYWGWH